MPTYDQLDDEAAWRAEVAAPGIARLASGLQKHFPSAQIGIRGDNNHLRGYHRSRRWIRESRFCTNRSYSVSRTAGDRSGGDDDWSCALDFGGIPQADLLEVCRNLDAAVREGRLEKITEWYGNLGGDQRVDGYDNIANQLATSDSSHLTHLHMSFDRGRANEDHSDVLAVLIGQGDDMTPEQAAQLDAVFKILVPDPPVRVQGSWTFTGPDGRSRPINPLYRAIDDVLALAEKIALRVDVDPAELEALKAAAAAGAQAGVIGSASALAHEIAHELGDELGLSADEVQAASERAVRKVLGTLDNVQ